MLSVGCVFLRGWTGPNGSIQGSNGLIQGSNGLIQGSNGLIQGSNGSIQGSNGSIQGSNGSIQGSNGSIQGSNGSIQGSNGESHRGGCQELQDTKEQLSRQLRAMAEETFILRERLLEPEVAHAPPSKLSVYSWITAAIQG
jgi:hypothetical protein